MTTSTKSQIRSSTDDLEQLLRDSNQRVTPQRLTVLGVFGRSGTHLTADEVFSRVEEISPAINRSTVYRILERFRDLGLVSETDLGNGVREFELLGQERHHHLICRSCGGMLELDDRAVEPLRTYAEEHYGFTVTSDHLALFGTCRICNELS